jgi:hypothetical protein
MQLEKCYDIVKSLKDSEDEVDIDRYQYNKSQIPFLKQQIEQAKKGLGNI